MINDTKYPASLLLRRIRMIYTLLFAECSSQFITLQHNDQQVSETVLTARRPISIARDLRPWLVVYSLELSY